MSIVLDDFGAKTASSVVLPQLPDQRTDRLEHHGSRLPCVQRVYVRTDDFRLAHRLLRELERQGFSATLLAVNDPLPNPEAWWFGLPKDVERLGGNGVGLTLDDVEEALAIWASVRHGDTPPKQLVIGFDPGPRPGCAYLSDGTLLGKRVMETPKEALDFTEGLVQRMKPKRVLVRVGNGSPNHRDQLINMVLARGYHVEEVNEERTSLGSPRHAHGSSALKIATMAGKPVHEQRELQASMGELRNLQRISRQQSKGRLTISLDTARQVSQGLLTMEQALMQAGYDAS